MGMLWLSAGQVTRVELVESGGPDPMALAALIVAALSTVITIVSALTTIKFRRDDVARVNVQLTSPFARGAGDNILVRNLGRRDDCVLHAVHVEVQRHRFARPDAFPWTYYHRQMELYGPPILEPYPLPKVLKPGEEIIFPRSISREGATEQEFIAAGGPPRRIRAVVEHGHGNAVSKWYDYVPPSPDRGY